MDEPRKNPERNNQPYPSEQNPEIDNQATQQKDPYDSPGTLASYSSRDEETAAELSVQDVDNTRTEDDDTGFDMTTSNVMGWVALALSAISFFWLPILFGAAGIITGFMARNRHARTLGNIAIIAGGAAIVLSLFVTPFM